MPIPYLLTTLLYVFVALLAAADASLVSLNLASAFPALRWVRVHFITLGIISQVVFGLLPVLVASLAKKPKPSFRWDIWLTLNAGFVALVAGFAGLLVDFIPMITGRPLGGKNAVAYIYWGMTLGAFGLVLGPWLGGSLPPTVAGLILHLSATILLIIAMGRALKDSGRLATAGGWHLLASYMWILLPVLVAPLILLGFIAGGPVEATAPQALIYGWVLQFGVALVPYIARRYFLKADSPNLGGNWLSLAGVTLGSIFVWVSIFLVDIRGVLYGIGFALYALAMIPPVKELFDIARDGFKKIESA